MTRILSGVWDASARHNNMMRSLRGLSSYLPLILIVLGARAVAQTTSFTPSNFQLLYSAVESRGFESSLYGWVTDQLRMQPEEHFPGRSRFPVADDPFCCRQVIFQGHAIIGFQYQSHQYLVLLSNMGTEHRIFLINDAGNPAVTLDATVPEGSHTPAWHPLVPSEAQPLVAAEEAFWLKWIDLPHL